MDPWYIRELKYLRFFKKYIILRFYKNCYICNGNCNCGTLRSSSSSYCLNRIPCGPVSFRWRDAKRLRNEVAWLEGVEHNGDKLSAWRRRSAIRVASWGTVPITVDVNLADETRETRLTRHEMVNERERRKVYSTRRRFFAAIVLPRRQKNDEHNGCITRFHRQLRKFQFIPVSADPVHPFKCHANGATNAPTKSRWFLHSRSDMHIKTSIDYPTIR